MINRSTVFALILALVSVMTTTGAVVFAQTYSWVPLGVAASVWSANGAHIYNTNAGSVVVGGTTPSGSLLLDVAGAVGGTSFCDQNGNNCFQPQNVQWRLSGNNIYNANGGNIAIGKTNPVYKVDVNGNVRANAFLYSSDQRLKTNIEPIHNALEIINNIQGVTFDWKSNGNSAMGLIAQEVEQVAPELVHTGSDGYKAVDYVSLIAPLVEVVKQQEQQIRELELKATSKNQCTQ